MTQHQNNTRTAAMGAITLMTAAACGAASRPASAALVFSDPAAWGAAASNHNVYTSFNVGLPPGGFYYTAAQSFGDLTLSSAGSPLLFNANTYVINGVTLSSDATGMFTFSTPVYAMGINVETYTGENLLLTLSDGETFTTPHSSVYFFGVIADHPFTSATLHEVVSQHYVWSLKSVSYAEVPEPASVLGLGAGLLALGLVRSRRANAGAAEGAAA